MKGRFQSALENKIKDEISSKAGSLAGGTAKSFDEYQYWVGYMAGLQSCLSLGEEIEREESDERSRAA